MEIDLLDRVLYIKVAFSIQEYKCCWCIHTNSEGKSAIGWHPVQGNRTTVSTTETGNKHQPYETKMFIFYNKQRNLYM